MISFYLGGVRCGKSRLAEEYVAGLNLPVTYVATAQAFDSEMSDRIAQHAQRRPQSWVLAEAPLELAQAVTEAPTDRALLIDCLSVWVTNHLIAEPQPDWPCIEEGLLNALLRRTQPVVLVTTDASGGITPTGALSRQFLDRAGLLNQQIAQISDRVIHVVAGLPNVLKDHSHA